MKKIVSFIFTLFAYFSVSGCDYASPILKDQLIIPSTTLTITFAPTTTPTPYYGPVLVETTVDFYRNGKTYTVVLATAHAYIMNRDIYYTLTPPPTIPEPPPEAKIYQAAIKEISDLDNDGEPEYTVLINECMDDKCNKYESLIKIFKYDIKEDNYYVINEFKTSPQKILGSHVID